MTQPFYDTAMRRLDEQLARIDVIERKAIAIFTFGSAILPITIALLNTGRTFSAWQSTALFIALALLGAMALCAALVLFTQTLDFAPDPEELLEKAETFAEDELRTWIGEACVDSILENEPKIARMALFYQAEVLFFVAAILDLVFISVSVLP